jgi:hypothetical protein
MQINKSKKINMKIKKTIETQSQPLLLLLLQAVEELQQLPIFFFVEFNFFYFFFHWVGEFNSRTIHFSLRTKKMAKRKAIQDVDEMPPKRSKTEDSKDKFFLMPYIEKDKKEQWIMKKLKGKREVKERLRIVQRAYDAVKNDWKSNTILQKLRDDIIKNGRASRPYEYKVDKKTYTKTFYFEMRQNKVVATLKNGKAIKQCINFAERKFNGNMLVLAAVYPEKYIRDHLGIDDEVSIWGNRIFHIDHTVPKSDKISDKDDNNCYVENLQPMPCILNSSKGGADRIKSARKANKGSKVPFQYAIYKDGEPVPTTFLNASSSYNKFYIKSDETFGSVEYDEIPPGAHLLKFNQGSINDMLSGGRKKRVGTIIEGTSRKFWLIVSNDSKNSKKMILDRIKNEKKECVQIGDLSRQAKYGLDKTRRPDPRGKGKWKKKDRWQIRASSFIGCKRRRRCPPPTHSTRCTGRFSSRRTNLRTAGRSEVRRQFFQNDITARHRRIKRVRA